MQKVCTKCNTKKSISEFYFREKRNLYNSSCKECDNNKNKEYYYKNSKRLNKINAEYAKNNKMLVKQHKNKYAAKNRIVINKKRKNIKL